MKKRWWRLIRRVLLCLVCLVCGGLALGLWYVQSSRFQEWARAEIVARLQSGSNLDVGIKHLEIRLFPGEFVVRGLTLMPRPGTTGSFRLSLEEARGSFGLGVLIRPRPRIKSLVLTGPRISLVTGASGASWNPEGFLRIFRRSLSLAVRKADVRKGSFDLGNRRIPFELSLENLICDIRYHPAPESYDIDLGYRNGRFLWAGRDIAYDLEARIFVGMDGVQFDRLKIHHRSSDLAGGGLLLDWRKPSLALDLKGVVAAEDMTLFHQMLEDARGPVNAAMRIRWDAEGFHADGDFRAARGSFRGVRFSSLRGAFEIRREVLTLRDVETDMGQGSLKVEGALQLGSRGTDPHKIRILARTVSLRDTANLLRTPELAFENTVDATTALSWRRGAGDLVFETKVDLHGLPEAGEGAPRRTALGGPAEFGYTRGVWRVSSADLRSPFSSVTAASVDDTGFRVRLATSRIAEPLSILQAFSSDVRRLLREQPEIMEAGGIFGLDGIVRFQPPSPASYEGSFTVESGHWRAYRIDHLVSHAMWNGNRLDLRSLRANNAAQTIEGDLGLQMPGDGEGGAAVTFRGRLRQFALATLREYGVELRQDLEGSVSGEGSVSYANGKWQGQGSLELEECAFAGERFDRVRSRLRLGPDRLQIDEAELRRSSAVARGRGSVGLSDRAMVLDIALENLLLKEVPGLDESGVPLGGRISASGKLTGTFDRPGFDGSFELQGLQYGSLDLGSGSGTLNLSNRILNARAAVRSELGALEGRARISTDSGLPGQAFLDFQDWNVQRLAPADLPALLSDLSTALRGNLTIEGRFADPASLKMQGEMDGARFKVRGYELRNEGKIRFTVANQRVSVDEAKLVGDGSALALKGEIPAGSAAVLNLALAGDLNLGILDRLTEKLRVSGSARLDVRLSGALRDPEVIGQAILGGAQFDHRALPFNLSMVQGRIVFSKNVVRLESIRGNITTGTFELSGVAELSSGQLRSGNLQASIKKARLAFPKDFRTTFDASLTLSGNAEAQVLSGLVDVTRAEYLRPLSLIEQIANRGSAGGAAAVDPLLGGLRLNLELQSKQGLIIDDDMAQLRAGFELRLRGTPAFPSLVGRIETDEGTVLFRGNRFDFVYGRADFYDRNRINPILDVRAEVDLKSYRLILDVKGPLDQLVVNLSSDPPLSTVDAVSLLTTGTTGGVGSDAERRESEVAGISAAGLLSEGLTGGLTKQVERVFGFQSFRVDPFLAGAAKDPTARVTITQRISRDVRVTYSRNLSKTEEQIVILEYDLTKDISLVAMQDERGGYGLDFRIRRRFR